MLGALARAVAPAGRMRRHRFWLVTVSLWLAFAVLFQGLAALVGLKATLVLYPLMLVALFTCCARRFHDVDKSAWWLLLLLVPVLGPLWVFAELALRRGSAGDNRYGPDPRAPLGEYLTVAT